MTAIALHVGLNAVDPDHYGGWDGALAGCERDAHDLASISRAQGYAADVLLTRDALAARVLEFLDRGRSLRTGDRLVLTFSGHGGQVPATEFSEDDGLDETWALYDRMIIDNEIRAALEAMPKGVDALVILDCCHSGTAIKAMMAARTPSPVRTRGMPPQVVLSTVRQHRDSYRRARGAAHRAAPRSSASAVLLAACQDNQVAADGEDNGLFTATLKRVWRDGAFAGDHRQFVRAIRALMPPTQTPNLDSFGPDAEQLLRRRPFAGASVTNHVEENTMTSNSMSGNWDEVAAELEKRLGGSRSEGGWMARVVAANAQAAQREFFGSGADAPRPDSRAGVRGGTVARAFWWGFHIEISHEDLQTFLASADPINAVIGAVGGGIPSPAAPFIALVAAFIAGALGLLRSLDRGRGVYVSMSWFAPGIFIPTSV